MIRKLQELLLGRWQSRSIEKLVDFPLPGIYLLKARTFGFKGFIGGTHSWIVHVDMDNRCLVAEVTNLETLKVQGATVIETVRKPINDREHLVFLSNREGGQKWFGAKPKSKYLGDISKIDFRNMIANYPLSQNVFNVLNANCNTFSSWIIYKLGFTPKNIGFGAKSVKRWKNVKSK